MNIVKRQGAKIAVTCALGALSFLSFAGAPAKAQEVVVGFGHPYYHHHYYHPYYHPYYHRDYVAPVVVGPPVGYYHTGSVVYYNHRHWRRYHNRWVIAF
jgi:hypothetical protein